MYIPNYSQQRMHSCNFGFKDRAMTNSPENVVNRKLKRLCVDREEIENRKPREPI